MDLTKVKKTCYACGADVTHKSRHKNGQGDYLCRVCLDAKRTSSRHRTRGRVLARSGRIFLYVLLAAAGAWLFYHVLDVLVTSSS